MLLVAVITGWRLATASGRARRFPHPPQPVPHLDHHRIVTSHRDRPRREQIQAELSDDTTARSIAYDQGRRRPPWPARSPSASARPVGYFLGVLAVFWHRRWASAGRAGRAEKVPAESGVEYTGRGAARVGRSPQPTAIRAACSAGGRRPRVERAALAVAAGPGRPAAAGGRGRRRPVVRGRDCPYGCPAPGRPPVRRRCRPTWRWGGHSRRRRPPPMARHARLPDRHESPAASVRLPTGNPRPGTPGGKTECINQLGMTPRSAGTRTR